MELCRVARALREHIQEGINTSVENSPAKDFQFELWGQIACCTVGVGGRWRCIQKHVLTVAQVA